LSYWTLLGIAVGLAMDAFAVSIAAGLAVRPVTPRHTFRIAFHFGLFQCLMPILGWLAGINVAPFISPVDHWLAFGLLMYVGGKMLWEAFRDHPSECKTDPTRGWMLLTLCVATSLDALAVGLSMAFLGISIWMPSVVIGLVTGGLSTVGITFGGRFGARLGRWAEIAGGVVLILIGLEIVMSHLRAG
jgi:manganese efflux pump family protein